MTIISSYNSDTGSYAKYCERCHKEIIKIIGIETLPIDFVGKFCLKCQIDALETSKKELEKHMGRLSALLKCVTNNIEILSKIKEKS